MEGRNKIVRKKIIKGILITNFIILLIGIIAFGPMFWNNNMNRNPQKEIIILLIYCIIVDILLWFLFRGIYFELLKMQESSLMVEKQLLKDKEVEVIPIRDDIPSLKALKEYSKFYAVYDGKDKVSISIKVNDKEKKFFESIHKDYFTYYYKLKEKG